MATLRRGTMNSSAVSDLQRKLNAAGYTPALVVDGDFGPKTEAAVRWYQQKNGLTVDGIVGPQTGGHLGLSGFASTTTNTGSAPTSPTSSGSATTSSALDLAGVPGGAQLWKVDGKAYLVYYVPNTKPPIPITYGVRAGELQDLFGPGQPIVYNRTMTAATFRKTGAIHMGLRTELQGEEEHPFDALVSQFERESQVRPWLRDPEVLAVITAAFLEGRPVTQAELQTTEWFRTRSPQQREWAVLVESDPVAAQNKLADARIIITDTLKQLGVRNAPNALINFLSNRVTMGDWTNETLAQQMRKIADPFAAGNLRPETSSFINNLNTKLDRTQEREDEVRALVAEWLGDRVAANWTPEQVRRWAGQLRNNPDAEQGLIKTLKQQRLALYPMYENENLSYKQIASAWEPFFSQHWGQTSERDHDLFDQVLRMNDSVEAAKLLRREGVTRGNDHVTSKLLSGMAQQFQPIREDVI